MVSSFYNEETTILACIQNAPLDPDKVGKLYESCNSVNRTMLESSIPLEDLLSDGDCSYATGSDSSFSEDESG